MVIGDSKTFTVGLHNQNKSGFYLANQSNLKSFQKLWLAGKKPALQKSQFCFDCYHCRVDEVLEVQKKKLFYKTVHSATIPLASVGLLLD